MLKRLGKCLLLLLIFCLLLFAICGLRLEADPVMLLGLMVGLMALCIYSAWDAAYGGKHPKQKISQWWLALLLPFALLSAAGHANWSTRVAGFQSFEIPSQSMENGVMLGDRVMVDRRYYEKNPPRDGDIAILMNPQGYYLIKRIVARGGETIESRAGKILLNGKPLNEPYVSHFGHAPPEIDNFGPLAVPAGKLFVMGDNRDVSLDSRSPQIGPIDVSALRGKALYTVRSPTNKPLTKLK
jgi:signal peptidase I